VRILEGLGFGVVALTPIVLWDIYSYPETGSWAFGRTPPESGFGALVGAGMVMAQDAAKWLVLPPAIVPFAPGVKVLAAALAIAGLAIGLRQLQRTKQPLSNIAPVFIFCLAYLAVLPIRFLADGPQSGFEPERYLSPVLAPLVVLIGFAIELARMRARSSGRVAKGVVVALTAAMGLSLMSSLVAMGREAARDHEKGVGGATTLSWTESGVVRLARILPPTRAELLLSNAPELMTYTTGRQYSFPPGPASDSSVDDLREQIVANGPAYFVYSSANEDPSVYGPDDLAPWFKITVLYESDDGEIDQLSLKP
jgi:hypothetical protein